MIGWHEHGCIIYADTVKMIGWVVKAGAEKYGNDILTGLGLDWEVEEYDQD